jgi:putative ABC transport system permease protein
MIKNYFKTAIRNIWKHKTYSLINILGLAIGLAIFSLTADLFKFQMSFNQFHQDADRIYSIVQVVPSGTGSDRHSVITRAPLRNLLRNEFQEIEEATRWIPTDRAVVRQERNTFYTEEGTILLVDSNFLTFFSFEMIAGDPETALSESNSVVLSESTARRYFGSVNAMGRKLTIWKDLEFVVKGVARDAPLNPRFPFLKSINIL